MIVAPSEPADLYAPLETVPRPVRSARFSGSYWSAGGCRYWSRRTA